MIALAELENEQPYGAYFPGTTDGHLHIQSIHKIIKRITGWNPHSLRHAGATSAYHTTRNLRAIQDMLGHSSLATSERYLHITNAEGREAALATIIQPVAMTGFTARTQFPPRYCVRAGVLWLSGVVYRTDAPTAFTTVFTLPHAPLAQVRAAGSHDLGQYIAIINNGQVQITATRAATSAAGYPLDGIGFALQPDRQDPRT